ncbi:MAG: hypothetical protein ACJ72A_15175, partial [Nocardioidaceae bacterium]
IGQVQFNSALRAGVDGEVDNRGPPDNDGPAAAEALDEAGRHDPGLAVAGRVGLPPRLVVRDAHLRPLGT